MTFILNLKKAKRTYRSETGVKGVIAQKGTGKFLAKPRIDGQTKYLGTYETIEAAKEAIKAYKALLQEQLKAKEEVYTI